MGTPKNSFSDRPTGAVPGMPGVPAISACPLVVYTCTTEFTISNSRLPLAHRPWSGGSPDHWLPPSEYRESKWFSASNDVPPPVPETPDVTVACGAGCSPSWIASPPSSSWPSRECTR